MPAKYVLITAAYNEERTIAGTIKSVLAQTHRPEKWIIVSDGSTDGTDTLIKGFSRQYGFIQYARQEKRASDKDRLEKVTIAQARAMAHGIDLMKSVTYKFLGNLDADTILTRNFYERIILRMEADKRIGIAGGGVYSVDTDGNILPGGFIQPDFVGGPVQVFNRDCLEEMGGYIEAGHADCVAVLRAKMKGWKVQCFPEVQAFQHEMPNNTVRVKVPTCFRMGHMDYMMGGLLTFQLIRSVRRMINPPYFLAGTAMLMGYFSPLLRREKIRVPKDIVDYLHVDQIDKLASRLPLGKAVGSIGTLEARYFWKNRSSLSLFRGKSK